VFQVDAEERGGRNLLVTWEGWNIQFALPHYKPCPYLLLSLF
jgi:hypothetical protein